MAKTADKFTSRTFELINGMMLDMLAAISRKNYTTKRERAEQGIARAKEQGKYKGSQEDTKRNLPIQKHLKADISSWNEIQELIGCSRGTIAKQALLLKSNV